MMRRSIMSYYMVIMLAVMSVTTLILFFCVNTFLEPFVISMKKDDVMGATEKVEKYIESNFDEDLRTGLNLLSVKDNLGICIFNERVTPLYLIYSSIKIDDVTRRIENIITGDIDFEEIYDQGEQYLLYRIKDEAMGGEQLEAAGQYGRYGYIVTTSLNSIHEGVEEVSRFFLFISALSLISGAITICFVSERFSKPIKKLAELSEQISRLDFSGSYTGKEKNEIGTLGNNINVMSNRLEETISSLREANAKLEADIEQKYRIDRNRRELIANISHELKTPIALIQGFAEGLKEGINDGDKDSMDYYCDVIVDESAKMNRLVKRLLDLDEIESGVDEPEMVEFNLIDLVKGVMQSSSMLSKDKDVTVKLFAPEEIIVKADEFMIEEVLNNYLSNACHYVSDPGKITVTVSKTDDDTVRVGVANTGSHIPEDSLSRIWDKFYKVDKARTREYGGSGIGLSIVRGLIERHNGSYGVKNTEDGVEFWFEIKAL